MSYNLQIQKLLLNLDRSFQVDDKISLLKDAINIADSNNDIEWGFELRTQLMDFESNTARCIDSFPAFAWLLDVHDNNKDLFDENDLLFRYEGMISAATFNPNISLPQIDSMMEDFKVRLLSNGYSLRSYYGQKADFSFALGRNEDVEKYLALSDNEQRDKMSDSEVSELNTRVQYYFQINDIEKALMYGVDLFTGKFSTTGLSFATNSKATYKLSQLNDKRATFYFEKAEAKFLQLVEVHNISQIANLSLLIPYLAKHDRQKGWSFFEKTVPWTINSEPYLHFIFIKNFLPLLKTGGTQTLSIDPVMPWYRLDNTYDVNSLFDFYYNQAANLAEAFDKRNSNKFISNLLIEAVERN